MANRKIFQLTEITTPTTSFVLPIQDSSGNVEARKVSVANLKTVMAFNKADVGLGAVPNVDATSRSNHSGTQLAATISDLSTAVDSRIGLSSLNSLFDVVITSATNGHILQYNGTNWVNTTISATIPTLAQVLAQGDSTAANGVDVNGVISRGSNGLWVRPTAGTLIRYSSALAQIDGTTGGLLIPRLTTTERNAVSLPVTGLLIFNTTDTKLQFYNGSAWADVDTSGGSGLPSQTTHSGKFITTDGTTASWAALPVAGAVTSGLVTTGAQTLAGSKTLSGTTTTIEGDLGFHKSGANTFVRLYNRAGDQANFILQNIGSLGSTSTLSILNPADTAKSVVLAGATGTVTLNSLVVKTSDAANTATIQYSTTNDITLTLPANSGTLALLSSPNFSGVPTAPTAALGTDTTQIATTAFVKAANDDAAYFFGDSFYGEGDELDPFESVPVQTGNAGKFLSTDGTNTSWQTVSASGDLDTVLSAGNISTQDAQLGRLIIASVDDEAIKITKDTGTTNIQASAAPSEIVDLILPAESGTLALLSDITGGVTDGDKGAIIVSSSGTVWSLDNNVVDTAQLMDDAVTVDKLMDNSVIASKLDVGAVEMDRIAVIPTLTILGNVTGGTTHPAALTAANVRTIINVEDGADVTDATNVDAAGAVMNSDTSTASMSFVVDEDDMTSNSATKVPTQQSVKAYVDAEIAGIGGISDGDKGDIVISGGGTVWTVQNVEQSALPNLQLPANTYLANLTGSLADAEGAPITAIGADILAAADAAAVRTELGLVIGTDVQAYDADLTSWAGKTAPSGTVLGTTDTQTLTNKRITPRVQTVTSAATVTPHADNDDAVKVTAQAEALTLANPAGTPVEMQAIVVRIKDDGTARAISYGSEYRAIGVTLPTTTVISKTIYLGLIFNSTDTKWDVIGYSIEA